MVILSRLLFNDVGSDRHRIIQALKDPSHLTISNNELHFTFKFTEDQSELIKEWLRFLPSSMLVANPRVGTNEMRMHFSGGTTVANMDCRQRFIASVDAGGDSFPFGFVYQNNSLTAFFGRISITQIGAGEYSLNIRLKLDRGEALKEENIDGFFKGLIANVPGISPAGRSIKASSSTSGNKVTEEDLDAILKRAGDDFFTERRSPGARLDDLLNGADDFDMVPLLDERDEGLLAEDARPKIKPEKPSKPPRARRVRLSAKNRAQLERHIFLLEKGASLDLADPLRPLVAKVTLRRTGGFPTMDVLWDVAEDDIGLVSRLVEYYYANESDIQGFENYARHHLGPRASFEDLQYMHDITDIPLRDLLALSWQISLSDDFTPQDFKRIARKTGFTVAQIISFYSPLQVGSHYGFSWDEYDAPEKLLGIADFLGTTVHTLLTSLPDGESKWDAVKPLWIKRIQKQLEGKIDPHATIREIRLSGLEGDLEEIVNGALGLRLISDKKRDAMSSGEKYFWCQVVGLVFASEEKSIKILKAIAQDATHPDNISSVIPEEADTLSADEESLCEREGLRKGSPQIFTKLASISSRLGIPLRQLILFSWGYTRLAYDLAASLKHGFNDQSEHGLFLAFSDHGKDRPLCHALLHFYKGHNPFYRISGGLNAEEVRQEVAFTLFKDMPEFPVPTYATFTRMRERMSNPPEVEMDTSRYNYLREHVFSFLYTFRAQVAPETFRNLWVRAHPSDAESFPVLTTEDPWCVPNDVSSWADLWAYNMAHTVQTREFRQFAGPKEQADILGLALTQYYNYAGVPGFGSRQKLLELAEKVWPVNSPNYHALVLNCFPWMAAFDPHFLRADGTRVDFPETHRALYARWRSLPGVRAYIGEIVQKLKLAMDCQGISDEVFMINKLGFGERLVRRILSSTMHVLNDDELLALIEKLPFVDSQRILEGFQYGRLHYFMGTSPSGDIDWSWPNASDEKAIKALDVQTLMEDIATQLSPAGTPAEVYWKGIRHFSAVGEKGLKEVALSLNDRQICIVSAKAKDAGMGDITEKILFLKFNAAFLQKFKKIGPNALSERRQISRVLTNETPTEVSPLNFESYEALQQRCQTTGEVLADLVACCFDNLLWCDFLKQRREALGLSIEEVGRRISDLRKVYPAPIKLLQTFENWKAGDDLPLKPLLAAWMEVLGLQMDISVMTCLINRQAHPEVDSRFTQGPGYELYCDTPALLRIVGEFSKKPFEEIAANPRYLLFRTLLDPKHSPLRNESRFDITAADERRVLLQGQIALNFICGNKSFPTLELVRDVASLTGQLVDDVFDCVMHDCVPAQIPNKGGRVFVDLVDDWANNSEMKKVMDHLGKKRLRFYLDGRAAKHQIPCFYKNATGLSGFLYLVRQLYALGVEDMARRYGINDKAYYDLEQGVAKDLKSGDVRRIADFIKVDTEALWEMATAQGLSKPQRRVLREAREGTMRDLVNKAIGGMSYPQAASLIRTMWEALTGHTLDVNGNHIVFLTQYSRISVGEEIKLAFMVAFADKLDLPAYAQLAWPPLKKWICDDNGPFIKLPSNEFPPNILGLSHPEIIYGLRLRERQGYSAMCRMLGYADRNTAQVQEQRNYPASDEKIIGFAETHPMDAALMCASAHPWPFLLFPIASQEGATVNLIPPDLSLPEEKALALTALARALMAERDVRGRGDEFLSAAMERKKGEMGLATIDELIHALGLPEKFKHRLYTVTDEDMDALVAQFGVDPFELFVHFRQGELHYFMGSCYNPKLTPRYALTDTGLSLKLKAIWEKLRKDETEDYVSFYKNQDGFFEVKQADDVFLFSKGRLNAVRAQTLVGLAQRSGILLDMEELYTLACERYEGLVSSHRRTIDFSLSPEWTLDRVSGIDWNFIGNEFVAKDFARVEAAWVALQHPVIQTKNPKLKWPALIKKGVPVELVPAIAHAVFENAHGSMFEGLSFQDIQKILYLKVRLPFFEKFKDKFESLTSSKSWFDLKGRADANGISLDEAIVREYGAYQFLDRLKAWWAGLPSPLCLSNEKVADYIGITPNTWHKLISGGIPYPDHVLLLKLARAMNLDPMLLAYWLNREHLPQIDPLWTRCDRGEIYLSSEKQVRLVNKIGSHFPICHPQNPAALVIARVFNPAVGSYDVKQKVFVSEDGLLTCPLERLIDFLEGKAPPKKATLTLVSHLFNIPLNDLYDYVLKDQFPKVVSLLESAGLSELKFFIDPVADTSWLAALGDNPEDIHTLGIRMRLARRYVQTQPEMQQVDQSADWTIYYDFERPLSRKGKAEIQIRRLVEWDAKINQHIPPRTRLDLGLAMQWFGREHPEAFEGKSFDSPIVYWAWIDFLKSLEAHLDLAEGDLVMRWEKATSQSEAIRHFSYQGALNFFKEQGLWVITKNFKEVEGRASLRDARLAFDILGIHQPDPDPDSDHFQTKGLTLTQGKRRRVQGTSRHRGEKALLPENKELPLQVSAETTPVSLGVSSDDPVPAKMPLRSARPGRKTGPSTWHSLMALRNRAVPFHGFSKSPLRFAR
ncbi:MAG TPA: hypothetical protein DDW49_10085 [Deltaproteobacteria bacterium]|nr:hypothetical protein [Deltaproteobacteria bacterium]